MARRLLQLDTLIQGERTGLLSRAAALWNFTYAGAAAQDVCLSMPRAVRTYSHHGILPPFEQQLPEMDLSLFPNAIWKIVERDEMGLLLIAGNRRLGRLRFAEPGADPLVGAGLRISTAEFERIDDGEAFLMDTLSRLAFVPGVSGVQPKTLMQVAELSPPQAPIDTHILKGNRTEYPWATVVEHATLLAARQCGLDVPEHALSRDGRLLAVRRFDVAGESVLGFDEACPLMGLHAAQKYRGSYEAMWRTLRAFLPDSRREAVTLLRHLAFCYATENGDAHLKNFGILYQTPADARLAPVYDVLTTTCFDNLQHDAPALTLGGRKVWGAWSDLERFGVSHLLLRRDEAHVIFAAVRSGLLEALPEFDRLRDRYPAAGDVLGRAKQAWERGINRIANHLGS